MTRQNLPLSERQQVKEPLEGPQNADFLVEAPRTLPLARLTPALRLAEKTPRFHCDVGVAHQLDSADGAGRSSLEYVPFQKNLCLFFHGATSAPPPSHSRGVGCNKRSTSLPLSLQAVATIFQLIETPSLVMSEVIREIGDQLLKSAVKTHGPQTPLPTLNSGTVEGKENEDMEVVTKPDLGGEEEEGTTAAAAAAVENDVISAVPAFLLTRFIALAGHVALKMLVHLEFAVLNEMKRREAVQEEAKQGRKHGPKNPRSPRKSQVCVPSAT